MPKLNTTTSGIITATLTADSSPTLDLQQNGVTIRTLGESQLVQSTTQSTATGATLYDFTGIPSWAKRITVMLNGVSTSSTSNPLIQIGAAGSITASGYTSRGSYISGSTVGETSFTTGFGILGGTATNTLTGHLVITNISGNIWICSSVIGGNATWFSTGIVTLSGTLDRVRITTVNGTDTFDAGTVNIMWE